MTELLQEFVDSRHARLRVDRAAGIIRGVKLLGLSSRNGRRYLEQALSGAVGLYEGAKVNINHPKGHPLSPRDYQDRLGVVRGVEFRTGEGLFGDLHFNPKHALSEQLVWDAENAPQNVGMSHNVLARTKRSGEETVVEAISKVQSIDLVADPATTSGLYEHVDGSAGKAVVEEDAYPASWDKLTLDGLRHNCPELILEFEQAYDAKLAEARSQLDAMIAKQEVARRQQQILELLREHDLPLPTEDGAFDSQLVSPHFIETLMQAPTIEVARRLIEERAALVHSAWRWNTAKRSNDRRPRSRDQLALVASADGSRPHSAAEFAASLRGS